MGTNYKEVGGGPATGLADQFIKALSGGITGSFGGGTSAAQTNNANPGNSTMGIMGVLNDLFSGGAGNIGGSMSSMISKQGERDVNALRSRFGAGGGQAFGTPAAYGEALLRSETAPKMTQAIGGLQLSAIQSLLPVFTQLAGKGISQRETVASPSPWATAASILGNVGSQAASIYSGAKVLHMLGNINKPPSPQLPALTPAGGYSGGNSAYPGMQVPNPGDANLFFGNG